jgi:hypothetical protein
MDKREKIKKLAVDMLNESFQEALKNIDKALDSGAINIEGWDSEINPMLLPKIIVVAVLNNESKQYDAKGTSFEKFFTKESKNIERFI